VDVTPFSISRQDRCVLDRTLPSESGAAIQKQAAEADSHVCTDFYYESMPQLAERWAGQAGPKTRKVFFTNSGPKRSKAPLSWRDTHQTRQVHRLYGCFTRSMGALSLTASKSTQRRDSAHCSAASSTFRIPMLIAARTVIRRKPAARNLGTARRADFQALFDPEDVAGIIISPFRAKAGMSGAKVLSAGIAAHLPAARHHVHRG